MSSLIMNVAPATWFDTACQPVTALATVCMLVVLIWYTIETFKLRKAAQAALREAQLENEFSLIPIVTLDSQLPQGPGSAANPGGHRTVIRNVGKGPALNIEIQFEDKRLSFDDIPRTLEPGQSVFVTLLINKDGTRKELLTRADRFAQHIRQPMLGNPTNIEITYEGATGKTYGSRLRALPSLTEDKLDINWLEIDRP